jgi:hypothetical protein
MEVIVSVAILIIVAVPTALVLINTQRVASYSHLVAEADDLATKYLEQVTNAAAGNTSLGSAIGTTYYQDVLGNTKFDTALEISPNVCNASSGDCSSVCQLPSGSGQSQITYVAKAVVKWENYGGAKVAGGFGGPVSLSSEIAPATAGNSGTAGEIAVPIENFNTTPNATNTIYLKVTGGWAGSGAAPTVPSGQVLTETENDSTATTPSGCVTFPNLDPTPGFIYDVGVVYCGIGGATSPSCTSTTPEIVDYNENGALGAGLNTAAPSFPTMTALSTLAGTVSVTAPMYLSAAATVPVTFGTYQYASNGTATPYASAWMPLDVQVGVQNGSVQCNPSTQACTLGNANPASAVAAVSTSGQNLYLYPYSDGYSSVYAGDMPESNPLAVSSATSGLPYYFSSSYPQPTASTPPLPVTTPSVTNTTEPSITVPLFYVPIQVNCSGLTSGHSLTGLTFTEVDGASISYSDQPTPLTCSGSTKATFNVGLPLGQYAVTATGTATLTTTPYIWVTPFGICDSSYQMTFPGTSGTNGAVTSSAVSNCSGTAVGFTTTTAYALAAT